MTTVVHCKRESYDVYIGRPSDVKYIKQHFGNPFSHKENSKAEVLVETVQDAVEQFEKWLRGEDWKELEQERRKWILKNLHKLLDKKIGCWCKIKGTEPCHGDIYIKLIKEYNIQKF